MNRNNRCWSAVETTVTTTRLDQHSRQDKKAFHFNHEALDIKYRTINNNYNSFHLIVVIIATSLTLHATISLQKQYLRARTIINNVFIYGKTYQDKTIWLDGAGRGGQDVTDGQGRCDCHDEETRSANVGHYQTSEAWLINGFIGKCMVGTVETDSSIPRIFVRVGDSRASQAKDWFPKVVTIAVQNCSLRLAEIRAREVCLVLVAQVVLGGWLVRVWIDKELSRQELGGVLNNLTLYID